MNNSPKPGKLYELYIPWALGKEKTVFGLCLKQASTFSNVFIFLVGKEKILLHEKTIKKEIM